MISKHKIESKTNKIIIAGSGGQGIMLLGKVIAEAAMLEDKFVTWLPAYGAEVRGGTANCMVVVSDQEIGSPLIAEADTLIAFNQPSFQRFKNQVKAQGIILVNSSLAGDTAQAKAAIERIPFTDTAFKLGSIKAANMVGLGAFVAKTGLVRVKTVLEVIEAMVPKDKTELLRQNIAALKEGMGLVKQPFKKEVL
jgi:2-oxoglutarate ferredoxin oxidoreductase subunit gamma